MVGWLKRLFRRSPYPFRCDLCGHMIESADDRIFWHGYGNCVDIPEEFYDGV